MVYCSPSHLGLPPNNRKLLCHQKTITFGIGREHIQHHNLAWSVSVSHYTRKWSTVLLNSQLIATGWILWLSPNVIIHNFFSKAAKVVSMKYMLYIINALGWKHFIAINFEIHSHNTLLFTKTLWFTKGASSVHSFCACHGIWHQSLSGL